MKSETKYIIERVHGRVVCTVLHVVVDDQGREKHVETYPLRHVVYHSPTGFEFGYAGSGPADLALSILAEHFGERQTTRQAETFDVRTCPKAWKYHQGFKWKTIAAIPRYMEGAFTVTRSEIKAWLAEAGETA